MCSKCQDLHFSIPHLPSKCPLNTISHCAICACDTDHTTEECTEHEIKQYRKVQYVEQLVPYKMLEHYNITTRTPISNPVDLPKPKYDPVLQVENTDKAINQILRDYEIPISGKAKENRRRLEREVTKQGLKIEYFNPK